jgi:hypothetical protein
MSEATNKGKVAQLINFIAGRGYPTIAAKDRKVELEIMRMVHELDKEKLSAKDTHDAIAGNWRLVFSTSEQLANLSSIMGGPLKLCYESIGNDTVHIATPFKGFFLMLAAPVVIGACLMLASLLHLSFVSAVVLTVFAFKLAAKFGPSGVYASRRTGLTVSDDMVIMSRLDRDVLAPVASQLGFKKDAADPMAAFCTHFDNANGSKDILKVGFLFGWRLVPRPFALHFKAHDTTRREKVVYVDENVRIMLGGDLLNDGSAANALSIYVKAS